MSIIDFMKDAGERSELGAGEHRGEIDDGRPRSVAKVGLVCAVQRNRFDQLASYDANRQQHGARQPACQQAGPHHRRCDLEILDSGQIRGRR